MGRAGSPFDPQTDADLRVHAEIREDAADAAQSQIGGAHPKPENPGRV